MTPEVNAVAALRITLHGRVQGLGVRPSIARLAEELRLCGYVVNDSDGVSIHVEGMESAVSEFRNRLPLALPRAAVVESIQYEVAAASGQNDFAIKESTACGPVRAQIPRDVRVCDECLREVFHENDRRAGYPFTSCTRCGPRYSFLSTMPYERRHSSMAAFPQCPLCRSEYERASDRRFHAQTNACAECGPRVFDSGRTSGRLSIASAIDALRAGELVALRGLGGYQILCDATNPHAVERLRERKRRRVKPFAVLVESITMAERVAEMSRHERETLLDPSNPVVLLRARTDSGLSSGIHPGLDTVGLMLPTTPLHALIARGCERPLVATSGNVGGEPLCADVEEAERRLGGIVDHWLHHDRDIVHRIDDSVVRVIADRPVTIRLARGLAPLPLAIPLDGVATHTRRCVVALGGHQKGAVAMSNGRQAVLGPHLGDFDATGTRQRLPQHVAELSRLLGATPDVFAHDIHPDFFTTRYAVAQGLPTIAVQHHHAHVVSGMIEHGWLDHEVLGVAFDGTGYGPDGTIWGGEFLLCTARGFRRVGHLRPFRLPGGEAAVREPWRIALSMRHEMGRGEGVSRWREFGDIEKEIVERVSSLLERTRAREVISSHEVRQVTVVAGDPSVGCLEHSSFAPVTSSAGRLFDAMAFLVLGCAKAGEEGRPAMLLEAACDQRETGRYRMPVRKGAIPWLDWEPTIGDVLADRGRGENPGCMAMRFHRAVAAGITEMCGEFPDWPIVLSGGVFQNRVLTELVADELAAAGRIVGLPGTIPPNDGGLAAGQLAVALAQLAEGEAR